TMARNNHYFNLFMTHYTSMHLVELANGWFCHRHACQLFRFRSGRQVIGQINTNQQWKGDVRVANTLRASGCRLSGRVGLRSRNEAKPTPIGTVDDIAVWAVTVS
ncbi:MAG: hypothetical protein OXK76_02580, partial [Gammaproteobacteria bacterium]|nr:hypothetical protein [Gammaproteobacteria bacterium]